MKRAALIGALIASLATGSAAFARDGDRGWDRDHDRGRSHQYDRRYDRRDYDRRDRDRHYYYDRRNYDHRTRYDAYYRPPGYYEHRWIRGERLPRSYYGPAYVITDYRGYGLRVPPRGYHWVRVNGDAVLAAIATGIVLDTVIHAFDW